MKNFYLAILFVFCISSVYAQVTKKVYFIGNSYTYYNDLPFLVSEVAQSANDLLVYQTTANGGAALQNYVNDQQVNNTITNGNWDYVVLQDQSQRPALHDSFTFPFAATLSNTIKNSSGCSKVMFFMTWGYKNGDQLNCNSGITHMCTYTGMDDRLYSAYVRLAQDNKGVVSPVGRVWRTLRQLYPQMELYDSDESHPSYLGSMAAAYTFYASIFKKDPTLATFNGTLSANDAAILKSVVKQVVYDELTTWSFLENNTSVDFNYTITDSATVNFINTSLSADEYYWDFGDGTNSTENNPVHEYTEVGEFTVTLTITKCNETYQIEKRVVIETLSLADFHSIDFAVYPNPTTNFLYVSIEEPLTFSIVDLAGKRFEVSNTLEANSYKIDVRNLANGIYWLLLNDGKSTRQTKFIKKN